MLYIIKPIEEMSLSTLTCSYECRPGVNRVMMSECDFDEFQVTDKNAPPAVVINFSRTKTEHRIKYDPKSTDEYQLKLNEIVDVFFKEHPLFTLNGEKTNKTKVIRYDIFSDADKVNANFAQWEATREIMNMTNGMSDEALRDAWYYYGSNPKGTERDQLILSLSNPGTGWATKDKTDGKYTFLSMFASGETSGERALRINLQKCLYYNIIVNKQNGDRNNFYHGREFIGTTHNDIISYFKREDKIYAENIVRKVKEMDELNHGATKKISDDDFKKAEIGENLLATTTTAKSFGSPKVTKQTIEAPSVTN